MVFNIFWTTSLIFGYFVDNVDIYSFFGYDINYC
jgi:hypothetical protein